MPGYEHASVNTMTFDATGRLYLAAVIQREGENHGGAKDGWGEPGDRVVLLVSDDLGETFDVTPVSDLDPVRPNWLVTLDGRSALDRLEHRAWCTRTAVRGSATNWTSNLQR